MLLFLKKGTASGISSPIQTKTIVGNEYVNLDLDVPVNAKFMYVTRFKNETNLDKTNYKTYANAFVIAEYKDRVELFVLTEFKKSSHKKQYCDAYRQIFINK